MSNNDIIISGTILSPISGAEAAGGYGQCLLIYSFTEIEERTPIRYILSYKPMILMI